MSSLPSATTSKHSKSDRHHQFAGHLLPSENSIDVYDDFDSEFSDDFEDLESSVTSTVGLHLFDDVSSQSLTEVKT
ncbi:hypothetical protein MAR_031134 [Mya arenaria]|uniref:Uncharacterized protein n=1 Tax=Mya arenaria TaxID=6604 RepID=A0ABY7F453_MYAAR|nr:hypothetical protein MAR_031134 [Mya arenaria]